MAHVSFITIYFSLESKENERIMNKLIIALTVFLSIAAVSCNDDNEPNLPANSITMNMMISDGETTLGGSDVYINNSVNFTTSQCGIADLGKKGGMDKSPNLSQIGQEVAVTPCSYYQIFNARDIRTVAGARAYPVDANFYNVYVDSWIYDKENDICGAKVSYAECYPEIKQLPEWDEVIELSMKIKSSDDVMETAEFTFPEGCVIDDDISVYDYEYSYLKDRLDIVVEDNKITFSNSSWTPGGKVHVTLLVRYESTYTRVAFDVESTKN